MHTSTHFMTIEIGFSNTETQKGRKIGTLQRSTRKDYAYR